MAVRILHLADIHLGSIQKFLPLEKQEDRSEEILSSFIDLLHSSINMDPPVDAILICGDLFDNPLPNKNLLSKVESVFKIINEREIPIILIPGNHDNIITPSSIYRKEKLSSVIPLLSPNIKEPLELTLQGNLFNFYGMAYSFLSQLPFDEFAPVNVNAVNIALIHGSLMSNQEWNLHSQDIPLDKSKLFMSGFDYIALGHYHEYSHFEQDGKHIIYPGSLEPLNWSEEKERRIVFVEFEGKNISISNKKSAFQKKFYKTVELNCTKNPFNSSDDIIDYVMKNLANEQYLLRLNLTGQILFIPDMIKIQEECQEKFYFLKINDLTSYNNLEKLTTIQDEETIRGLTVRKLFAKMQNNKEEEPIAQEALKILMGYFSTD